MSDARRAAGENLGSVRLSRSPHTGNGALPASRVARPSHRADIDTDFRASYTYPDNAES